MFYEILGIVVEARDGRTRPVLPLSDSIQEEPDTSLPEASVPEVVLLPNGGIFYRRDLHNRNQNGSGADRDWKSSSGVQAGELPQGITQSTPPCERSFQDQMHDIYEAFGNGTDLRYQLETRLQAIKAQ